MKHVSPCKDCTKLMDAPKCEVHQRLQKMDEKCDVEYMFVIIKCGHQEKRNV